jgi:NSS family neurotransmitter:Na+ symporter
VINFTTVYSQPILGVLLCVFAGWIWRRDSLLAELKQGNDGIENSFFWKVWPVYVRFLCPVFIIAAFIQSVVL